MQRKAHETSQEEEDEPEEEETEGPFRESKFSYDGKVITFADLASLTKGLQVFASLLHTTNHANLGLNYLIIKVATHKAL